MRPALHTGALILSQLGRMVMICREEGEGRGFAKEEGTEGDGLKRRGNVVGIGGGRASLSPGGSLSSPLSLSLSLLWWYEGRAWFPSLVSPLVG